MKLNHVPALSGALWVRRGFEVFLKQPLAFTGLFTGFLFFALLALLVPVLGPPFLLVSLPLVSLGFMLASKNTLQGQFATPGVFIAPLRINRDRTQALVKMGALYALASIAVMMLSDLADGGKFAALQAAMGESKANTDELAALLIDPQLHWGLMLRMALAGLLSLPFWHAPALVHWGALAVGKALFFSVVACWRNWTAFAVYGLSWSAVVLLLGTVVNAVVIFLLSPPWIAAAAVFIGLFLSTAFYASLYFTFVDCFALDDTVATEALNEV